MCGPPKVRRSTLWSPPPLGVLKFNVDGAARGKLGPVGIGGVCFATTKGKSYLYSLSMLVFVLLMKRRCELLWKLFGFCYTPTRVKLI